MFSPNVAQAINFLTLPLIITQTADKVASVQSVLRSTLSAALPSGGQLTLTFSPTSLPPRPVLAACIACDFAWDDWMTLLGNRDFDLIIEPHDVLVTYFDLSRPYTITVWSEPTYDPMTRPLLATLHSLDVPQVPISKLGQKAKKNVPRKSIVNSIATFTKTRTLAQQLLEENHKQEADEIFEMISKTSILSPTPTRQEFPALRLPSLTTDVTLRSDIFSSDAVSPGVSSRSSSRSSMFSSLSSSDDEGSLTSASSTTSFNYIHSDLKEPKFKASSPVFIPRHLRTQIPLEDEPAQVIVDSNKAEKVKYLYQGGYTTVVTGGVMLGSGSPGNKRVDGAKNRLPPSLRRKPVPFTVSGNKRLDTFHNRTSTSTPRF